MPVGTCEPHGPHLPYGCDTLIIERLADELSADLQLLRAPTLEYGVNTPVEHAPLGGAGLRRKSLLRALNDLIDSWEAAGVREFILITAHGYDAHVEALSTVITKGARVQVVDVLDMGIPEATASPQGALHGDEIDTSLLLYLHPELVHMTRAADYVPAKGSARFSRARLKVPRSSPGSVGRPTSASAEKGAAMYKRIKGLIRDRVLLRPPADDT